MEKIREYLVALGFKIDEDGWRKFNESIARSAKGVAELGAETIATAVGITKSVDVIARQYEQLYYVSKRAGSGVGLLQSYEFAFRQIGLTAENSRAVVEGFAAAVRTNPGLAALLRGMNIDPSNSQKAAIQFTEQLKAKFGAGNYFVAQQFAGLYGVDEMVFKQLWGNLDGLKAAQKDAAERMEKAGVGTNEAAKKFTEFSRSMNVLQDDLGILATRIAQDFVDPVKRGVEVLSSLIEAVNELDKKSKGSIGFWGTLATSAAAIWATKKVGGALLNKLSGAVPAAVEGASGATAGAAASTAARVGVGAGARWLLGPLGWYFGLTEDAGKGEDELARQKKYATQSKVGTDADIGNVTGMNSELVEKLRAMRAAMPEGSKGFTINSGKRTTEEQARLYAKYGPGRAAPPGHSKHETGDAADLEFGSAEAKQWIKDNAEKYGIGFPVRGEDWHAQVLGGEPGGNKTVRIQQHNEITVQSPDPAAAGRAVASEMNRVSGDIVRNAGANIR